MPQGTPSTAQAARLCLVAWFAFAALGLTGSSVAAQQREIDSSLVGAEVRITGANEKSTRGIITSMWLPDSLAIRVAADRRAGSFENVTLQWNTIHQLDRRVGNQLGRGMLIGLATSAAFGLLAALNRPSTSDLTGPGSWALATGVTAVLTVPVGALIGSQYPRWRPVYRSGESRR